MIHHINLNPKKFIGILLVFFFTSCQFYHDTTSKYNAYFLAYEKMKEVENALFDAMENDYNDVLYIYDVLDTTKTASHKESLEYVIKKASLPIKWHKTSKWVDDCYNLVGKARVYLGDKENAINTFKYVYANSDDPNAKHEALIWLTRIFIENGEEANMQVVKNAINKEKAPFSKENTKLYHLTMAHYYRLNRDFENTAQHLALGALLETDRKKQIKYNFTLGQVYKVLHKYERSFEYFSKVARTNSNYNLEFISELNAQSLASYSRKSKKRKEGYLDKYFEKKLKDLKNWDLRDRIYYEMANMEIRKDDYDKSLNHLNESIQLSTVDKTQKGYSYLLSGKVYYTEKEDFENAAAYYDSAIQILPKTIPDYESIAYRADYLKDLAKYTGIIRKNDKLINLYSMSEAERDSLLTLDIEKEKEALIKKKEDEKHNEQRRKKVIAGSTVVSDKSDGSWYFYNNEALRSGGSQFLRIWGSRPLEDNWRRSRKPKAVSKNLGEALAQQKKEEQNKEEDIFASLQSKEDRLKEIPADEEQLQKVKDELAEAIFALEKVYVYKVRSNKEAASTTERLLNEFTTGEHTSEAAYIMYTYCQDNDCDENYYRDFLLNKLPESFYAQILKNPNYVAEKNQRNVDAEKIYKKAFSLYKSSAYEEASKMIEKMEVSYANSLVSDKVGMLKVLISAKTSIYYKDYYQVLNNFITSYPESELLPMANNLLKDIDTQNLEKRIPGRYEPYQREKEN